MLKLSSHHLVLCFVLYLRIKTVLLAANFFCWKLGFEEGFNYPKPSKLFFPHNGVLIAVKFLVSVKEKVEWKNIHLKHANELWYF